MAQARKAEYGSGAEKSVHDFYAHKELADSCFKADSKI